MTQQKHTPTASDPICRSCATQEHGSIVPEGCTCTALVASPAATPGPWKATTNAYGCHFVQRWEPGEAHQLICGGNSRDTLTEANAHLIAAAPNLLAALNTLVAAMGCHDSTPEEFNALTEARAAVAAAEGSRP